MNTNLKRPVLSGRKILNIFIIPVLLVTIFVIFDPLGKVEAGLFREIKLRETRELTEGLIFIQGNSLLSVSTPPEPKVNRKMRTIVTSYSSSPWETDGDPYITAAGTSVRDGVIANNKYPFGTRIRFPEIYGDKIFVVEDRMHWRKGLYQFDIWMSSYQKAKEFGAKMVEAEILKD